MADRPVLLRRAFSPAEPAEPGWSGAEPTDWGDAPLADPDPEAKADGAPVGCDPVEAGPLAEAACVAAGAVCVAAGAAVAVPVAVGVAESEGDAGGAASTLCYVVELSDEQLTVRPIHRLVSGLGAPIVDVLAAHPGLSVAGEVTAEDVADGTVLDRMDEVGAVAAVHADGSATLLAIDPRGFEGVDDLEPFTASDFAKALAGL